MTGFYTKKKKKVQKVTVRSKARTHSSIVKGGAKKGRAGGRERGERAEGGGA